MILLDALIFAAGAHAGQKRKYTGADYFTHCVEVAGLLSMYGQPQEVCAAGALHDVIEDTRFTAEVIQTRYGRSIASWVVQLTNEPHSYGNRRQRKDADLIRLAAADPEVKTIKCADLISNASSIVEHDPKFAILYLAEKREILRVIQEGADQQLWALAHQTWLEATRKLMGAGQMM